VGRDGAPGPRGSDVQRALNRQASLCGLMRVRPIKQKDFDFSKTNFYSTQKSIENWEKYLGTSENMKLFMEIE
jgi:hypothetical protein